MAETTSSPRLSRCGTYAGYSAHRRDGSPACEACLQAVKKYQQQWRLAHPRSSRRPKVKAAPVLLRCRVCGGALKTHEIFGRCYRLMRAG